MRRKAMCAVLLSLAIVPALAAGGNARSVRPEMANLNTGPRFLPATVCGFRVDVRIVESHLFRLTIPVRSTAPAGTIVVRTAGEVVLKFVNDATGKAIVRGFGGFTSVTKYPDGTGTRMATGRSWIAFTPLSQANIPATEPHLVFISGQVKIDFATTPTGTRYVTGISRPEHHTDGCALLGGRATVSHPSGGAPLPNLRHPSGA